MKHAAAVAALFALLALPATAQHGGARGGSGGGHASGGFAGHAGGFAGHGGFGGGSAPHFGGFESRSPGFAPRFGGLAPRYGSFSPRYGGYAPRGFAPRGFMGPGRTGYAPRTGAGMNRTPYRGNVYGRQVNAYGSRVRTPNGGDHDRRSPHRRPYYNGFNGLPYAYNYGAYPLYPYDIDPWLFGPDWDDDSDQSAQNDYGGNIPAPYPDYGESGDAYGGPAPSGEYYAPQPYPETGFDAAAAGTPRSLHRRIRCSWPAADHHGDLQGWTPAGADP